MGTEQHPEGPRPARARRGSGARPRLHQRDHPDASERSGDRRSNLGIDRTVDARQVATSSGGAGVEGPKSHQEEERHAPPPVLRRPNLAVPELRLAGETPLSRAVLGQIRLAPQGYGAGEFRSREAWPRTALSLTTYSARARSSRPKTLNKVSPTARRLSALNLSNVSCGECQ